MSGAESGETAVAHQELPVDPPAVTRAQEVHEVGGVLSATEAGRVLLVRHAGHQDGWAVLGGAVEIGESPAEAAVREAGEEIGADIRLKKLLDVLGGPDYEVTYPNGDRVAYVTAVYEAEIIGGVPRVADGEISDVAWFRPSDVAQLGLNRFSIALLKACGHIRRD